MFNNKRVIQASQILFLALLIVFFMTGSAFAYSEFPFDWSFNNESIILNDFGSSDTSWFGSDNDGDDWWVTFWNVDEPSFGGWYDEPNTDFWW